MNHGLIQMIHNLTTINQETMSKSSVPYIDIENNNKIMVGR